MAARAIPAVPGVAAPALPAGRLGSLFGADVVDAGLLPTIPHRLSTNIDHLMADWGVTLTDTGVIKAAMMVAMFRIEPAIYPREGAVNAAIVMITTAAVAGGGAAVIGSSANVPVIEANDNGNFLRKVILTVPAATRWLQDLVASHQIRALSPKNIEGYFMSKGDTKVVGRELTTVINYTAKGLDNILGNDVTRSIILHNAPDWIKYHTTATGTAGLVFKAVGEINASFPGFFSPVTVATVTAAHNAKWNKTLADAIPPVVLQIVYVYLKTAKKLPDEWYQGARHYADMGPATSKKYQTFFKRYFELAGDSAAVDALANLAALTAYQTATGGFHGI